MAVVVAVGVLLAGCGGSNSVDVTSGAAAARKARLVRFTRTTEATNSVWITGKVEVAAGGTTQHIDLHGAVDFANNAFTMTSDADGSTTEVRGVDGVTYLKVPVDLGGRPWVEVRPGNTDMDPTGTGLASVDPARMLESLRSVSTSVTEKPGVTIAGQSTTEYDADVDLSKAVRQGSPDPDTEAKVGQIQDMLGFGAVPVKAFVDGDGRVVRLDLEIGLHPKVGSGSEPALSIHEVIDFTDYGAPVDVQAPPPDQVTDLAGFQAQIEAEVKAKFHEVGNAIDGSDDTDNS